MAWRSRAALGRLAADDPANCRIVTKTFGIVHILVASEMAEHRLPQQADRPLATVLAGPRYRRARRPPARSIQVRRQVHDGAGARVGEVGLRRRRSRTSERDAFLPKPHRLARGFSDNLQMARSLAARVNARRTHPFAGPSQIEKLLDLIRAPNQAVQDHEIS